VSLPKERTPAVARRRERPHTGSPARSFVSVAATASGGWDLGAGTSARVHDETSEWHGRAALDAPFGEDDPQAEDDDDVLGNTFGPEPKDPLGGGLAIAGVAPGGGGHQAGIGLGRSGPMGRGSGPGRDQGSGVSDATLFRRDATLADHQPRAPSMTLRVPRHVVDRVMSRNAGRLQSCMQGSTIAAIDLSFEIDSAGAVSRVEVGNYAGPSEAVACVESALRRFHFLPAPQAATPVEYRVRMR
jgi:hypothetical protein